MTANSSKDSLSDLDALQWSNRILLLFPGEDGGDELMNTLEASKADIRDRDMAWFVFLKDSVVTNLERPLAETFRNTVCEQYGSGSKELEVVLIGKDGGVKARYDRLNFPDVYALIDSMPMRQAEMRRRD